MNVMMVRAEVKAESVAEGVPAFREFQQNLTGWLAEPPAPEQLTVVGSYGLF
jgi:hypothetical protein